MNTASGTQPVEPFTIRLASALFELQQTEPTRSARVVLKTVCVLFLVLLAWAVFAKLDIVAVAQGRLVPKTYVKIVQPAEAGIIREILVQEGQRVAKGQVLVRLDPTVNAADARATTSDLGLARLQLRRIESELAGRPLTKMSGDDATLFAQVDARRASHRQAFLDSLAQETAARQRAIKELAAATELARKLEATLPSYERTAQAYEKLARDKLVGTLQAEEHRRVAIEQAQNLEAQRATLASLQAAVSERQQAIAQLKSNYASELSQLRLETQANITRLTQQQDKLTFQGGLLELRAPQTGIVKELATTTLGAVVQPGSVLLSLVPHDEPLVGEVLIDNKDVGFVAPGQRVRIKLAAYQFQKYGMLEGTVRIVSADSSSAASGTNARESVPPDSTSLAFKALIDLKTQNLPVDSKHLPIAAGMQVSAEIVQGNRTVLEYFLSPVQKVVNEAAMEK